MAKATILQRNGHFQDNGCRFWHILTPLAPVVSRSVLCSRMPELLVKIFDLTKQGAMSNVDIFGLSTLMTSSPALIRHAKKFFRVLCISRITQYLSTIAFFLPDHSIDGISMESGFLATRRS